MAAAPAPVAEADAAPKKGKKKLIIILAAVLLVVLAGGGAAVFMMKKKAAAEAEDSGDEAPVEARAKKDEHKSPPVFVPLEPFVVNLADRESERFAQIGVTLQVEDSRFADEIKLYMPAVRNGVLMVLAHKTSRELLERSGKEKQAAEIMREAVRPMGIHITVEEEEPPADTEVADAGEKPKAKKKAPPEHNPVVSVNFSSFIIQ
jgi:flagellar FliL protein